jgi:hypothetical protein
MYKEMPTRPGPIGSVESCRSKENNFKKSLTMYPIADAIQQKYAKASYGLSGQRGVSLKAKNPKLYRTYFSELVPEGIPTVLWPSTRMKLEAVDAGIATVLVLTGALARPFAAKDKMTGANLERWQTWISTLAGTVSSNFSLDPEVTAGKMRCSQALTNDLAKVRIEALKIAKSAADSNRQVLLGDKPADTLRDLYERIADTMDLPPTTYNPKLDVSLLADIGGELDRACYYSLVLMLAGRHVTTKEDSISDKRPKNLEAKFYRGNVQPELSGHLKMSSDAVRLIDAAWSIDGKFRVALMTPAIGTLSSVDHEKLAPIALMVRLMAWSGMTPLKVCFSFISAYPFVTTMPEFAREVAVIRLGLDQITAAFPGREEYSKILDENFTPINSKEISKLTALAVEILQVQETSLAEYRHASCDPLLLAAFNEIKDRIFLTAKQPVAGGGDGAGNEGSSAAVHIA